jgi:phosphatidylinositol glycan class T
MRRFRVLNRLIVAVHIAPNPITFSRILTGTGQLEGGLETTIRNNGEETRRVKYVEVLPWWIQPWMHELRIDEDGRPAGKHDIRRQQHLH